MTVVLVSTAVVAPGNVVRVEVAASLDAVAASGVPVVLVSNHSRPSWFGSAFPSGKVHFVEEVGRQNGSVVRELSASTKIPVHNFIVFGAGNDDVQMAKNGGAVLVMANWANTPQARGYGISVASGAEFVGVAKLSNGWSGGWYFSGTEPRYSVRALADVSGIAVGYDQKAFAQGVVRTVKNGGPNLFALLTVVARSFLTTPLPDDKLFFGLYPSSTSTNMDGDVLSDFCHRLRSVTSRVQFAKRGAPLLIRHSASTKRSGGGAGDRTDPAEQVETLHLNPVYRENISGRNVIFLDDCTTYGVSFGVAAALLRKAGAKSVHCVALGKFGAQLRYYEIDIQGDPFAPINGDQYDVLVNRSFKGAHNETAQAVLRKLLS